MSSRNTPSAIVLDIDFDGLLEMINSDRVYSYAELCDKANLPCRTGRSKEKQLQELYMICDFTKRGSRFRFNKLRSPSEIELCFLAQEPTMQSLLEYILATKFYDIIRHRDNYPKIFKYNAIFVTPGELLKWTNLTHLNYHTVRNKLMKGEYKEMLTLFCSSYNYSPHSLATFSNDVYVHLLKPLLDYTLERMDNRMFIQYNKGFKLYSFEKFNGFEKATETDYLGQQIFKIRGEELRKLGLETKQDLVFAKETTFKTWCDNCNYRYKNELGYDLVVDCYVITIPKIPQVKWTVDLLKKEVNNKNVKRLLETKQLNKLLPQERKQFVSDMISESTKEDYIGRLKELQYVYKERK